jgi:hypothetical protein
MSERSIFLAALEYAPSERSAYLDSACAGDQTLRGQVEQLLTAHEQSGSFMCRPAPERLAGDLAARPGTDDTRTAFSAPPGDEGLGFLEPSDAPGSLGRLGHYEVQEVVGRGGMGIVLRAFDRRLHRVVAIKVMAAQLATSATARRRFTREARAVAAVSHDHVVTVYAVEEDDRLPHIVMQYVAGASLQERLDRSGPQPLTEILRIGMQTAAGLAAAHAQGLVHRDVKPANILLENGVERVKLTDFGLARAADDASLTQSGAVAGTPAFMSPEQAEGKQVDHRSDLFSLGSVLYAMCTGRPPFRAGTSMGVLKRVCEQTPAPIRETNPAVPDWLVAVVEKLHAKEPEARFQSAAEVAEVLGRYLAHVQHPTVVPLPAIVRSANRPPSGPWQSYRNWWAPAAAVLVGLFAALGTTEATGVTNIRAMVIRMFTPEGTLVVETDAVPPTAEREAFVLLGGQGSAERKFDTLAAAVVAAEDGDTIEVRGNGPFFSDSINLGQTALTIRAAQGFRPVIKLDPKNRDGGNLLDDGTALSTLFVSNAPLVLEGLELQRMFQDPPNDGTWRVLVYSFAPLYAANCRFVSTQINNCISAVTPICELRNCEFLGRDGSTLIWSARTLSARLVIDNCVNSAGPIIMGYDTDTRDIQLTRNTLVTAHASLRLTLDLEDWHQVRKADGQLRAEVSGNVFDAGLVYLQLALYNAVSSAEGKAFVTERVGWQGQWNLFARDGAYLHGSGKGLEATKPIKSLANWKQFWGSPETGSIKGQARYQGGDLVAKLRASPEKLTPDDFRLRADSAGYRAGKDGKDLGADIDLVGPGPAYERWKKTPEYQQWLQDIGQRRAEAPRPDAGAFVRLDGKGGAERKFDTLAEAVKNASTGDTIEVRGNGPFLTEPIDLGPTALTIRSGAGFRPVIKSSPAGNQRFLALLETDARLTLEGLEIQRIASEPMKPGDWWVLVYSHSGPLHAVNCRFVGAQIANLISSESTLCELRNCEIHCRDTWAVVWDSPPDSRLVISNCLQSGHILVGNNTANDKRPASIQLTNNTLVWPTLLGFTIPTENWQHALNGDGANKVLRVEAAGNVLVGQSALVASVDDNDLPATEVEAILAKRVGWKGEGNLYSLSGSFLRFAAAGKALARTRPVNTLADWNQFWGSAEVDSDTGKVRFRGGNLLAKLRAAPETITPEDFHLCSDSAGYKAGKDGKDLGADVDLVGPGPAYERWKKTPDYQQWRKDTGQLKK